MDSKQRIKDLKAQGVSPVEAARQAEREASDENHRRMEQLRRDQERRGR